MIRILSFIAMVMMTTSVTAKNWDRKAPAPKRAELSQSCVIYRERGTVRTICLDPLVMELFDLRPGEEISPYEAKKILDWKDKALLR